METTSNNKLWIITIAIIAVIVIGVGAFLGGISYQKSKDKNTTITASANSKFGGFSGGSGGSTSSGRRMGFGGLSGTIASISSSGITITTSSGSTETINFETGTTYATETATTQSDLAVGQTVTVTPDFSSMTSGSDGTTSAINATKITVTPAS